ncbi:MAG: glycosyltransferase family 39 protein [Chloroflexi bacterium]|nr:glycosyltransferase family 39 protein [Chloroflexota bacterium]
MTVCERGDGNRRKTIVALLGILLLAAVLRLGGLASESLWYDEAYSVWVARHDLAWQIAMSIERIYPPTYYLLLHIWMFLGDSEFVVRALSAVLGIVSVALIYILGQALFDSETGLVGAFLLAIAPLHIWYSQEARMYILVALLLSVGNWALWRAVHASERRYWALYAVTIGLAFSAHYHAVFILTAHNLYMIARSLIRGKWCEWRPWLVTQGAALALAAVGLAGIFSEEATLWWGELTKRYSVSWVDLIRTAAEFTYGLTFTGGRIAYWGGLALTGACCMVALVSARHRGAISGADWPVDEGTVYCLFLAVVPVLAVWVVSLWKSFYVLRYLFPFMPPYLLLVARGARLLRSPFLQAFALIAMVVLLATPLINIYILPQKEDWRAAVAYVSEREEPGDWIYFVDYSLWIPFDYYYQGRAHESGLSRWVTDYERIGQQADEMAADASRVWLVQSHLDKYAVEEYLLRDPRFLPVERVEFLGIRVVLFEVL